MTWREAPGVSVEQANRPSAMGSAVATAAPIVVAIVLVAWTAAFGEVWRALVLAGVCVALLQVRAAVPQLERRVVGGLARAGRVVGTAVGIIALAIVFAVLAATSARPRRWRSGAGPVSGEAGWVPLGPAGPSASSWQSSWPTSPRRRDRRPAVRPTPGARLVRALGFVAVFVVIDLIAGAVLSGTGLLLPEDRGDVGVAISQAIDSTMSAPPIVHEPWAEEFARAMAAYELGGEYVPYLVTGFHRFESRYVNVTDEERVSYEPHASSTSRPLRVAFFGGSVMFGVGQRDEHTIPSEFARLAEAEGIPIEVHNYGRPAWVSWQEQIYLEQLLARGRQFDLVVFLDGFNDFEIQDAEYSTEPTHNAAGWIRTVLGEVNDERQDAPGYTAGLGELLDDYRRNSATWRVLDALTGRRHLLSGDPSKASATRAQRTDAALDVYARSVERIDGLAADHDIPVHYFWQPRRAGWRPSVIDRLPPGVVSLAGIFDGEQESLYLDDVHTNESGAQQLAAAMWSQLGEQVRDAAAGRD